MDQTSGLSPIALDKTRGVEISISTPTSATVWPSFSARKRRYWPIDAKDRRFDGVFVTGVLSTGIYCRPSCPARPPRRENVRFFARPEDAEAAGLRPCLRCRPDAIARDEGAVVRAIAMLRDEVGVHAQQFGFGFVRVGHKAALKPVAGASQVGATGGNHAARAALGSRQLPLYFYKQIGH